MKLIIFEVVSKKDAKRCHTIEDVIALSKKTIMKIGQMDYETIRALTYETFWLINNPVFLYNKDMPDDLDETDPVNIDNDYGDFSIRIIEKSTIITISKNKADDEYTVSVYDDNGGKGVVEIGYFSTINNGIRIRDDLYKAENVNIDYFIKMLTFLLGFVKALITGELELKTAEYKPIVKHGRLRVKSSGVVRYNRPHLVASHDRAGHFKVLRSPRYYKDGIVPENEDELRRIPVKGCHVKRDIERVVIQ